MPSPLVSICIPAYQNVDFLRRNLLTIEKQNFKDFELVVSDDSYDDDVRELIYTSNLVDRLIYNRNKKPLGSPENWNKCISMASGKYIKIMHHDDFFSCNDALQKFVNSIENSNTNFVFSSSSNIDFVTKNVLNNKISRKKINELMNNPGCLFFENLIGSPSCVIFKRGISAKFDSNLKWLVDVDFYLSVLSNEDFLHLNEKLIETTTNSTHQITHACEDNPRVEFYENLYLVNKHYSLIFDKRNQSKVIERFHRVFDRFNVRNINQVYFFDNRCYEFEAFLKFLFKQYRYIFRIPYLVYRYIRYDFFGKLCQ